MGSCKYYMEVTLGWMLNNKVIVFLSLLSFCLFVSTLALAGQKNRLYWELDDCRSRLTTTVAPTDAPTAAPTAAPVAPNVAASDATAKDTAAGESKDIQNQLMKLLSGAR